MERSLPLRLCVAAGYAVIGLVACGAPEPREQAAPMAGGPSSAGSGGSNGGAGSSSGGSSLGGSAAGLANGGVAGLPAGGTTGGASGGAAGVANAGGLGGTSAAAGGGGGGGVGGGGGGSGGSGGSDVTRWVGTWGTAQQLTEEANKPPAPGLTNNTLRQIVRVSIGGQRLRLRFSNEYGSMPVTIQKAHCAVSSGGSNIMVATDKALAFNGAASVTIQPKTLVYSDAFDFPLTPLSKLAVSIQFGATSSDITGHPGSRTTSYLQSGDAVASASMTNPTSTDHWYVLSGIEVQAATDTHALVILGDSITDGRGSTTNGNDRWPDALAERLQANPATARIGVLNQGIGGNAVLSGGLGPTAQARFQQDVLKQGGARWLIVFEGVNDIGEATAAPPTDGLTQAYQQFVTQAHGAGLKAFGATITPFRGHSYYTAERETARQTVNTWIRKAGNFDAVIDMDAAVRDPAKLDTLLAAYDQGDHLHLNPAGYKKLAETVDLTLLQ